VRRAGRPVGLVHVARDAVTRRMVAPLLFGILGVAVLLALGVWQVQRLAWKTEILARIDARRSADPVAVPEAPSAAADQYRRVRASGVIGDGELHIYTSVPLHGVGYRVIAPLALADGRRVLLDRGFVPIAEKKAHRRRGRTVLVGALLWPQEADRFTSPPDREKNVWFVRDVPLMAAALETEPVMIVAEASDDPAAPLPQPVTPDIPNDHLAYAVSWFGLAAVWAGMTGRLLWRLARRIE
jgi:surfeit locus 1 family protein